MTLRALSDDMSPDAVRQVDAILAGIARDHGVHVPWAIESGSRAWGFPSPDSDYDGRFIYVRPADDALTIWPRRDVIETPLVGDMDVNGWDLAKALRLLLKGNAVVIEWLQSPIIYAGEAWFRDALLGFADRWVDRARVMAHYRSLGSRQKILHMDGQADIPLKKVFYALRPAMALRWLRAYPDQAVAPMHFPTLMNASQPSAEVMEITRALIVQKASTREMGVGPIPQALRAFIDAELEIETPPPGGDAIHDARIAADALFAMATRRLDQLRA